MNTLLVLIACTYGSTEPLLKIPDCRPVVLTEMMPMYTCIALSQPMAAKWSGEHPTMKIRKIACMEPRRLQALLGRTTA